MLTTPRIITKQLLPRRALKMLVAIVGVALMSSCTFYRDIEVSEVKRVNFKGFDRNGIVAEVTVAIDNPNGYRLLVRKAEIDVDLNNKKAGTITYDERYIIPRKSNEEHTFLLSGAFSGGAGNFLDNLLNLLISREAVVKGNGYIQGKAFFISRKVPVSFSEQIDMRGMNVR
jgi:LEA14-like dessication related protein